MSIQVLRGPSVSTDNPVLAEGQPYVDIESNPPKLKIGDGSTGLNDLPYIGASVAESATKATQDGSGNLIVDTYATKEELSHSGKRTCRFVIGTSANGWTASDCDYLCDGTSDEVEINQAIQALPVNGGSIVILEGQYNLQSKINITKPAYIYGRGINTKLCYAYQDNYAEGLIAINCSYVTIRDMFLYCDASYRGMATVGIVSTGSGVVLFNLIISGMYTSINLSSGTNRVIFNYIDDSSSNQSSGLSISGSNNIVVGNNFVGNSASEYEPISIISGTGNIICSNHTNKPVSGSPGNAIYGNQSGSNEYIDAPGGILVGNIKLVYNSEKDSIDFVKVSE